MRKKQLFFCLLLILMLSYPALAVEIKGVVVDAKTGAPLPGANVFVKGTNLGAASNKDGVFVFNFDVAQNFILVASFMGYKKFEREFSPNIDLSNLKIEMEEDVFQGEEVVVTGIASKREKSVAEVAVSRVPASQLTVTNSYQDLSQLVAGKVPGVKIEPASGNVGGGIRFNMRSAAGINGDEQPLIIVDGVRIDNSQFRGSASNRVGGQGFSMLADLNPEDIDNIEILKGPAGAASYGTSGSNGVVLITTKKGQFVPGVPKGLSIDYKMVTGYNAQAYQYTENDFPSYQAINGVFRDGRIQQHTLSAYGGSGIMKYYFGLDKRYEDGISPNNFMDRQTIRANFDVLPNDKVIFSVSTGYTLNENSRPYNDNNIFGFLGNTILTPQPWMITDSASVYGLKNEIKSNRFFGSMQVQYRPFKNFEVQATLGMDDSDLRLDNTYPANLDYAFYPAGRRGIESRQNTQYTYNFDAKYTYSLFPGLSMISSAGAQLFDSKNKGTFFARYNFLSELITNAGAGADVEEADETFLHTREAGLFTTHSLSYLDQYFLTVLLRQDYASAIGRKAPNIFYPGASLAVRLDKYKFFPSLFNLMKVRAAYGESGQLPQVLDGIPLLWAAEASGYGGGAVLAQIGNAEIEPERIKEFEVGFETELFTYYSAEFTYYKQTAENSIISFRNAPSTGQTATDVPYNIGSSEGWGIESLVQAKPFRYRNFQLDVSLTNSYQTNKVTDLGGAQPIYDGNLINVVKEGLPKHSFYDYKVKGALFNDDGTYAGPDLETEKSNLGTPIPTYDGSLSLNFNFLKNFNLYVLTDWATGYKILNDTKRFAIYYGRYFGGPNNKRYRELQDILGIQEWYDNITAVQVGSQEYINAADEYAKMDFHYKSNYIESADNFKLREISISYSFKDLIARVYKNRLVSDLVVGLSGRNLWRTSKYSGADIEVNYAGARSLTRGQDFLTLQQPRVYNLWLRVSL